MARQATRLIAAPSPSHASTADPAQLMLGLTHRPDPAPTSAGATEGIVCHCNNVAACDIRDAVADGATDVEAIGERTRAGTGCTGCRGRIQSLLDELSDEERVLPPPVRTAPSPA